MLLFVSLSKEWFIDAGTSLSSSISITVEVRVEASMS